MEKSPMISVIMSVYNVENDHLEESIKSILMQTFHDFEFIIFDDNTNDENKQILIKFRSEDQRIILVTNNDNIGLTANLCKGINIAKGKYICRQDADDISLKKRFEFQFNYMEEHNDISMLCCGYYRLINGKKTKRMFDFSNPEYIKARLFLENSHIMHSSVMIRKGFLKKNNLNYNIDIKKAQDFDLWVRITEIGKITILKKRLCIYRISPNQISTASITKAEQRYFSEYIILKQLHNINMHASEKQKRAHLSLATGNTDIATYKEVYKWVKILFGHRQLYEIYDRRYIRFIILKRFLKNGYFRIIKNIMD